MRHSQYGEVPWTPAALRELHEDCGGYFEEYTGQSLNPKPETLYKFYKCPPLHLNLNAHNLHGFRL